MKPSNDLFHLIKSLNKSEKGYFKKYTAKHIVGEKNAYMTLFEAIDKQQEYDEAAIKNAFSNTSFIRRLPALKNYLYALILKSQRAYYAESSATRRMRGLLDDIQFLSKKRLFEQAMKTLARARKLAEQYEMHYYLLMLEEYERKLQAEQFMSNTPLESVEENFARERELIEELLALNRYEYTSKRLFKILSEQGISRKKNYLGKIEEEMKAPWFQEENQPHSMKACIRFYHTKATYAYYCGNYEESYKLLLALLDLMDARKGFLANYADAYISTISNIVGICCVLLRKEEALFYLGRLRLIPIKLYSDKMNQRISVCDYELILHLTFGEYEQLRTFLPTLQEEIRKWGNELPIYYQRYFAYYMAWGWFALGNMDKTLYWLNSILNDRTADVREDLYCFAKILNLLVHYEMDNTELLHCEIRSTYRYLIRRQRNYQLETVVVKFVRKMASSAGSDIRTECLAVRQELVQLHSDPFERRAFEYFHFIPWIESKIERIGFGEAVRRYVQSGAALKKKHN